MVYHSHECVTVDRLLYHYCDSPSSVTRMKSDWDLGKKKILSEYAVLKSLCDYFDNTAYRIYIYPLAISRIVENMEIILRNNDRCFFYEQRGLFYEYLKKYGNSVISRKKRLFIKCGFTALKFFYFLHGMKHGFSSKKS